MKPDTAAIQAAVEELELPAWLPGETPPAPLKAGRRSSFVDPAGKPFLGTEEERMQAWSLARKHLNLNLKEKIDYGGEEWLMVSSVYLGIDHAFGDGPPLLFETLVFAEDDTIGPWRYSTQPAMVRGHGKLVQALRELACD